METASGPEPALHVSVFLISRTVLASAQSRGESAAARSVF